jgi:protein-S-isoprenylcysteine O-methyltransferase Ste14
MSVNQRRELKQRIYFQLFLSSVQSVTVLVSACRCVVSSGTSTSSSSPTWMTVLMVPIYIVTIISAGLWAYARFVISLTGNLTLLPSVPPTKRFAVHGPYRYCSHPIYVFGTIAAAGFLTIIREPLYLLAFLLVMGPVQIFRVKREQSVLLEKFGASYEEYLESCIL